MGYQDEYADEEEKRKRIEKYGNTLHKLSAIVTDRIRKPWFYLNPLFRLYTLITGNYKLFRDVYNLPFQIIRNKKQELNLPRDEVKQPTSGRNFIDILLHSEGYKDSPEQALVDEVITFMVAGSETTTITLCFTILMLAMHPNIQENVYEELHAVFGDSDRPAEMSDLNRLTLMECCIKETLRRFPPVPIILREAEEDVELSDGTIIPAGTTIVLSIMSLHVNDAVYEQPKRWNPNRFLYEETAKRSPANYAPFSSGPRSCIGAKYAMLVLKTQLSTMLRRFEFTTDMKMRHIRLSFDTMLRNKSGFRVRTKPRKDEPTCCQSKVP